MRTAKSKEPTLADFIGKKVKAVVTDNFCEAGIEFTDGTRLIFDAEGYDGTRLHVYTEVPERQTVMVKRKVELRS
jgi:hypothetical protein